MLESCRLRARIGFLAGLALGDAPLVVGAAVAVALAELDHRGEVQGMVEGAVAALGDAVHGAAAGGELGRGGAVVGGVAVPVGEAGDRRRCCRSASRR